MKWVNLPYAHSSMASAFWNSEKGKIMICRCWYWSVLWPVISKVMNQKSLASVDLRYSCMSIRIIGRSNQLNVGTLFLKTCCITTPLVQSWFQVIRHWWVRLQVVSQSVSSMVNSMPNHQLLKLNSLSLQNFPCKHHHNEAPAWPD